MLQSRSTKVIALSLGTMLSQLAALGSGIVLVRLLTKDDFATYLQTMLAYSFAAPFLSFALPSAFYFFLPRWHGAERTVLLSTIAALAVMGSLFSIFLLCGGAQLFAWRFSNPKLIDTLKLLSVYPVVALPTMVVEACLVARNRVKQLTLFNLLSRVGIAVSLIVVCWRNRNSEALVLTQVVLAIMFAIPAFLLMWRACDGKVSISPMPTLLWRMISYSIPLGLANMLGTMTLQSASIIVSSICSPREFAVYSVGASQMPLISIITGSITTVLLADMSRLCQQGRKEEALRLFGTAAWRSASLMFPAMVFLFISAEPFIVSLFSSEYIDSILPFRLYLLTLPIRIVTYGAALLALGLTREVLVRSLVDFIVNAALCIFFVKLFGYLGALFAILTTLYTWTTAYNLRIIARGFDVHCYRVLPFRLLFKILGLAVVMALPTWLTVQFLNASSVVKLASAAILYWPVTLFLLNRSGCLPIPPIFKRISKMSHQAAV